MTEVKISDAGGATMSMVDIGGFIHPNFLKTEAETRRIFENVPNFKFRDDDLMLCTFAKNGTNWTFEILMMILKGSAERVKENKALTMIELVSAEEVDMQPSPRVINCHYPPRHHSDKRHEVVFLPVSSYRYLPIRGMRAKQIKTILGVRNPKDTAVSYYNHMKGFSTYEYNGKWENWLPVYLQGKLEYGKHADYLKEWQHLITDGPGFPLHVMYYEDLKMDGIEEINKLLKFLDIELDEKLKKDIIEMCEFQKMAEEKGREEIFTTYSNNDFQFFRKGQVGDWKNWFTVAQNEMFDEIWEKDVKDADIFKFKYA